MDLLKTILAEHGPALVGQLQRGTNLNQTEAERFLPEAGTAIGSALSARSAELDLGDLASASNIGALADGIDIGALASRAGVSPQQGRDGIATLLPAILGFLKQKAGSASDLLELFGGGDAGGALGALKGLGSRFLR